MNRKLFEKDKEIQKGLLSSKKRKYYRKIMDVYIKTAKEFRENIDQNFEPLFEEISGVSVDFTNKILIKNLDLNESKEELKSLNKIIDEIIDRYNKAAYEDSNKKNTGIYFEAARIYKTCIGGYFMKDTAAMQLIKISSEWHSKAYNLFTELTEELKVEIIKDLNDFINKNISFNLQLNKKEDILIKKISIERKNRSYRQMIKLANTNGFFSKRMNGDHLIMENKDGKVVVVVAKREMGKGLQNSIIKEIEKSYY